VLDDVVEAIALAHMNVDTGVGLDAFNGDCVRATSVNGDFSGTPRISMALYGKCGSGWDANSFGTNNTVPAGG